MASEEVEVIKEWFACLEHDEVSLELFDPEVEIRNWAELPNAGPYHGLEGVERWWSDTRDVFEHLDWELLEMIELGDGRVLTIQRFAGRFRYTGLDVEQDWGSIFTVRGGKIVSAHGYPSPGRAKKAAGLKKPEGEGGKAPRYPSPP